VPSHLIDDDRDRGRLVRCGIKGLQREREAGQSLGRRVFDWFSERGVTELEEHRFLEENIEFRLPVQLRRELELADSQL
jgi:hypothetical protein